MVTGNTVSNNAFDRRNNIMLHVAEKAMQTGTKKACGKTSKVGKSNQGPEDGRDKLLRTKE